MGQSGDGRTVFPKPKRSRAWIVWLMVVAVAFGLGYGIGHAPRCSAPSEQPTAAMTAVIDFNRTLLAPPEISLLGADPRHLPS
jgi:hypothetical protein